MLSFTTRLDIHGYRTRLVIATLSNSPQNLILSSRHYPNKVFPSGFEDRSPEHPATGEIDLGERRRAARNRIATFRTQVRKSGRGHLYSFIGTNCIGVGRAESRIELDSSTARGNYILGWNAGATSSAVKHRETERIKVAKRKGRKDHGRQHLPRSSRRCSRN